MSQRCKHGGSKTTSRYVYYDSPLAFLSTPPCLQLLVFFLKWPLYCLVQRHEALRSAATISELQQRLVTKRFIFEIHTSTGRLVALGVAKVRSRFLQERSFNYIGQTYFHTDRGVECLTSPLDSCSCVGAALCGPLKALLGEEAGGLPCLPSLRRMLKTPTTEVPEK